MTDFLRTYQIYILFGAGFMCLIQGLYLTLIQIRSIAKKRSLIMMQLCIGFLLIADAFAYIYRGNTSQLGWWMVRISNFVVFFNTSLSIFLFNLFLTYFIMETGKYAKLPAMLLLGFIIQSVAMTLIVISQFTDLYYFFDEQNRYHRGPLYIISFILPYLGMAVQISVIIKNRKVFSTDMLIAVLSFSFLPLVAGITQVFMYGLSLINLSLWVSSCIVFAMVLTDQNKKLMKAADTEGRTGLPNTSGYEAAVDKVINYKDITAYNAYYFDIKRMSMINEKYGKPSGDEVIVNYAHEIKRNIDQDEVLGCLGGNFFVALIKKVNTDKFLKLLACTPVEFHAGNKKENINLSAVAGIYEIKSRRIAAGQLLSYCSTALVYAKNEAHLSYVYLDKDLEDMFTKRHAVEAAAKTGLAKNEFEPFYQPKVDSRTNRLCGSEALVRWRHDGKLIPPGEFISILEKNRNICDLDFYILRRVCQDMREWIKQGIDVVPVSVNFSRRNLEDRYLAQRINSVVESYDIPRKYIQIEITETIDEYPMSVLCDFINALHEYGFKAAIDDFGVGSSSINLLKSVKFDVLKIDKTFIDFCSGKDKVLLSNITKLAGDMGIDTVAEGVEEKEQVETLKEMNCYVIQGYIYSKPVEKQVYEERLKNEIFSI